MNDLTQDLRDYRAHLESELAIMAKATAGPWEAWEHMLGDEYDRSRIRAHAHRNLASVISKHDDATAIAAARNGYEPSLRAQLQMLEALEESIYREVESAKILRAGVGLSAVVNIEKCPSVIALRDIIAAWKGGRP